ncbi:hypothetical protein SG34_012220 [Thalassomonas viridans]|uniref:Uncharacterized protein n=1 Tax=Thalassomonas viridans TaxID=137584 RepID=A0AAE9Z6N1_9GAMM|nr:hypothetical protein [Thalassomonas viridans]WDE07578.1 hypothetical protein SG34_012220 [Thalassomonas viridans]
MVSFNISRINTPEGIFRLAGAWCRQSGLEEDLKIESIEILGTDGWVALKLSQPQVAALTGKLAPQLLAHLLGQDQA